MNNFKIDKHPKINSGFSAPDDFFKEMEQNILAQTIYKNKREIIVFKSTKFRWLSGMAAAVLLLISLTFLLKNNTSTDDIDATTLENYLSYNPEVTTYQIIALMNEEDLQNLEIDLNIEQDDLETYLETKNIEKYLID